MYFDRAFYASLAKCAAVRFERDALILIIANETDLRIPYAQLSDREKSAALHYIGMIGKGGNIQWAE